MNKRLARNLAYVRYLGWLVGPRKPGDPEPIYRLGKHSNCFGQFDYVDPYLGLYQQEEGTWWRYNTHSLRDLRPLDVRPRRYTRKWGPFKSEAEALAFIESFSDYGGKIK